MQHATSNARRTRDELTTADVARLSGALLIAGAAASVVANLAHPVLEEPGAVVHMYEVHVGHAWVAVHIGLAVGILLMAGGLATLRGLVSGRLGGAFARVGAVFASAGGTLLAISLGALDGYVISSLATRWRGAGEAQRELIERQGALVAAIDHGILAIGTLTLLGLGLASYGVAFVRSRALPAWLGGTALALGAAGITVGTLLMLLGPTVLAINTLFRPFAMLATVFFIILGIASWRRGRFRDPAGPTRAAPRDDTAWATEG